MRYINRYMLISSSLEMLAGKTLGYIRVIAPFGDDVDDAISEKGESPVWVCSDTAGSDVVGLVLPRPI